MKYFKNTELAKLYNVSEKSVRNWVDATHQGKLDLELFDHNGKEYVANTSKNVTVIEELVAKGKKYKNSRGFKTIVPPAAFYETYDKQQIRDIISSITIHKEIPIQYGYLDGGAESWDHYSNRLVREQSPNILTRTTDLIDLSAPYVDQIIGSHQKVNVVDLGPGNGLPIRATLARLLKEGRLNRYIAIDISHDMLSILRQNIDEWFGGKVIVEGYVRNFSEERFDDLFTEDHTGSGSDPVNLVFLLGGTLSNARLPDHLLRVINLSLGSNDLLFYSGYLDTPYTQRYFDLSGKGYDQNDPQQSGLIPSLLNINESLCDFELLFSEEKRCRFKWMIPKVDLSIKFEINGKTWDVELQKKEPILLWRHRHYSSISMIDLFYKNDFDLLQATKSEDQNYTLLIVKIKTGVN
jgi:uncharacterized SAM-dependent methyltransferase